jgi:hypothetical protein
MPRLIEQGHSVFGDEVSSVALQEFLGWPEPDEMPDKAALERAQGLFWPWLVFNWEYDRLEDENGLLDGPEETTIAELYRDAQGIAPQSAEGRLIAAANRNPYTFLEIASVRPGQSVQVRDLLTGAETIVQEVKGSEILKAGDIVFGRAIQADAVGMFLGLSAFALPPGMKPQLIALRRAMSRGKRKVSREDLYDWDLEIRDLFWDLDRALRTPPELQNTDGDPLESHKLIYDIESPALAVEKLAPLCATETLEEIMEMAEKTSDGRIRRATLHWQREGGPVTAGLPNTLLGTIEIDGHRMTVSVNSARRAATMRKEIQKRLGKVARLRLDEIEDLDAMMAAAADKPPRPDELMEHPDIRQHLEQMLTAHWDTWVDQEIPALGNKTPKEAVRTADGREAVEALLQDAERTAETDPIRSEIEKDLIAGVRRLLKLDSPRKGGPAKPDPQALTARLEAIKRRVTAFGDLRLHDLYTGFAVRLCDTIAESDLLNIHRGRIEIWAAAIAYAIAQLNMLFYPETPNHLSPDELCNWFQVKKTTVSSKAAAIRNALDLFHDDERFCAPHIVRGLRFVEDESGFILPASSSDGDDDELPETIALKPPLEAKDSKPQRAAESAKKKKNQHGRQLSLFED